MNSHRNSTRSAQEAKVAASRSAPHQPNQLFTAFTVAAGVLVGGVATLLILEGYWNHFEPYRSVQDRILEHLFTGLLAVPLGGVSGGLIARWCTSWRESPKTPNSGE